MATHPLLLCSLLLAHALELLVLLLPTLKFSLVSTALAVLCACYGHYGRSEHEASVAGSDHHRDLARH